MRRKQVEAVTGLGRSSIYLAMAEGRFPKPIPLGPRAVGWLTAEISRWIAAQTEKRGAAK